MDYVFEVSVSRPLSEREFIVTEWFRVTSCTRRPEPVVNGRRDRDSCRVIWRDRPV